MVGGGEGLWEGVRKRAVGRVSVWGTEGSSGRGGVIGKRGAQRVGKENDQGEERDRRGEGALWERGEVIRREEE